MPESSQDLSNNKNDQSSTEDPVTETQHSASPGRILRAAREELGYSLEQVAQELHLRPSVVLAMEEEKYDDFTSDVFLKGYFRSYCRMVNLHEVRMIELLETQLSGLQKDIDDAANMVRKAKKSKKQKKLFIYFICLAFIVGGIFILINLFYTHESLTETSETSNRKAAKLQDATQSNSQQLSSETDTSLKIESETKIETVEAKRAKKIVKASENTAVTAPVQVVSEQVVTSNIAPEKPVTVITEGTSGEQASEPETAKRLLSTTHNEIENSTSDTESVTLSLFEAEFTGDCWFKLVDAKQKTVFAALKRHGDLVNYTGIAPFQVVLGDATKVALSFNGEGVNLKAHTSKNGRAQLTLTEG